ncbi:MAG: metal ABC transporter permease, partial [Gammaproteobacteria bacterium]|nr:metal ABC transporter permease [Gammaproteobacteria bacterium]
MDVHAALFEPFVEFGFMRRALVACLALSVGSSPVGVLLVLRRMSLVGDALSHAVLPGAAIGFMIAGLSLLAMSLGGFIAGLVVAILAGVVARVTPQREDASFAAFYLISLALGVLVISTHGSNVDLVHVLFGTILAVDDASLLLVVSIATVTLFTLAVIGRGLIVECFDPGFLRAVGGPGAVVHFVFLALVVMNLVAGFHALGTLMAVGLMMLPAAVARFWAAEVATLAAVSSVVAFASGYAGLLLSYHADLPSGPAIILVAGGVY